MVGDFNLPNIDWNSFQATSSRDTKFLTALQDNYMEQMVDFTTHTKGNCLDLLITNMSVKVKDVCEMGRLGKSDHVIIQISLTMVEQRASEVVETTNWRRADWQKIKDGLRSTNWPSSNDGNTAQEAWDKLRSKLDSLIEENVPKCSFRQRK